MTESLRNHGDHGGATAVFVVQAPQWHRAFGVTGVVGAYCGGTAEHVKRFPRATAKVRGVDSFRRCYGDQ